MKDCFVLFHEPKYTSKFLKYPNSQLSSINFGIKKKKKLAPLYLDIAFSSFSTSIIFKMFRKPTFIAQVASVFLEFIISLEVNGLK